MLEPTRRVNDGGGVGRGRKMWQDRALKYIADSCMHRHNMHKKHCALPENSRARRDQRPNPLQLCAWSIESSIELWRLRDHNLVPFWNRSIPMSFI